MPDEALRPPSPRSEGFGCGCCRSQPSAAPRRQPQRTASAASRQLAVTALGCNGCRCAATDCVALQRMPPRATAGGAMRRAVHRCTLRCDATSSACPVGPNLRVLWGYSRGALGRCNRLRWDATGNAAIQHDEQRCGGRGTPVCAHVRSSGCLAGSVASSSVTLPKAYTKTNPHEGACACGCVSVCVAVRVCVRVCVRECALRE